MKNTRREKEVMNTLKRKLRIEALFFLLFFVMSVLNLSAGLLGDNNIMTLSGIFTTGYMLLTFIRTLKYKQTVTRAENILNTKGMLIEELESLARKN